MALAFSVSSAFAEVTQADMFPPHAAGDETGYVLLVLAAVLWLGLGLLYALTSGEKGVKRDPNS